MNTDDIVKEYFEIRLTLLKMYGIEGDERSVFQKNIYISYEQLIFHFPQIYGQRKHKVQRPMSMLQF